MKNKLKDVVQHLVMNRSSTVDWIEKEISQNKSAICSHIRQLNDYIGKQKLDLIQITREDGRILISDKTREYLYIMLKKATFVELDYIPPELRTGLIVIKLSTNPARDSLKELADFAAVSKNTMLHDMKAVKESLRNESLDLQYSRKDGYQLIGSEYRIRKKLVIETKKLLTRDAGAALLERKGLIDQNELFLLKERLMKAEKELKISLTDEQIEDLPIVLYLLIRRIKECRREWTLEFEEADLIHTKEYQCLKNIFWGMTELSENDKLYLSLQVLSSNKLESALDLSSGGDLVNCVHEFLDVLEGQLATDLMKKEELKHRLLLHLRPAVYRIKMGLNIDNPLKDQFIGEFPSVYSIVSNSVFPIEKVIGLPLSQEEVAYLAMIVQAWIHQTEGEADFVFKALVVCRNGISVSKLLLETLKGMFPHFQFIGAYAERNFKEHEQKVDFIFSTVPLNTVKKTFLVDPILNEKDRFLLKKEIQKYIEQDSEKKARELLFHLKDYIDQKDYPAVQEKLMSFFNQSSSSACANDDRIKGEKLFPFSEDHIGFTERDMSWEEALEQAIKPMKLRGSINENYKRRLTELFAEESRRMMIGPFIYLPHAKPDDGVVHEDFSILICRHRVVMPDGNAAKAIVVLAPEDEHHHVPTLLHLNDLFLNDSAKIWKAQTKRDVLDRICLSSEGRGWRR
ncbi:MULTISPECIES: BglG family transcription antiterminator [Bacillus]|uniref:BglG family transcription antiterminator n=1 Tax=Bacillus TaxID=1386 RepID=UPI0003FF1605|nr:MULTISPECIES: BglG family transcription antiterminator [Bacillus]QHZ45063.1 BglG family transcription antiterminator [Bacillus sp. NSP9.1]WFA05136.1 BglG family transcription antiterminator [Bacillus sp. HSf4]